MHFPRVFFVPFLVLLCMCFFSVKLLTACDEFAPVLCNVNKRDLVGHGLIMRWSKSDYKVD